MQSEPTSPANADFQILQFTFQKEKKEKSGFPGLYLVLSLSPEWCFRLGVTFGLLLGRCTMSPCAQGSGWEGGKTLAGLSQPQDGRAGALAHLLQQQGALLCKDNEG